MKSFRSLEEANNFINGVEEEIDLSKPIAYVDGSFNKDTNEYSFGAILVCQDKMKSYKHKFSKDEYSTFRNVAGEVRGASFIINKAISFGMKELNLYYDYAGIENWYMGLWKANNELTKEYQEFAKKAKEKIDVKFIKVKSHSNNKYNDLVDKLAKEALGL